MSNIFNPSSIQENLQKLGNFAKSGFSDDLSAAQQIKRAQNTRDYGLGLQSLVDNIGKAQSSFYQGAFPGKTIPKVVSPAAGASLGYYAASVPASFIKNPLWNLGIRGAGAGVGALVGLAGSKNATDDEKKASQIGLEEFGATKPYRQAIKGDTDQLKANALTNIGGLAKFPFSITDSLTQFGGQFGKRIGEDLEKSNNKIVSGYGKLVRGGSEKSLLELPKIKQQREEGINKLLNLAYGSGKLDIKKLPVDVLSELSPEFVKSIISGKGIEKFSIPDEISLAYNNSQTKKGSTEIENYFKGKGKNPEEIKKLKEIGMASKPVASLYQSIITDPTNLVDLPVGSLKGKTAEREARTLNQRQLPAQLTSGIRGELNAGREVRALNPSSSPEQEVVEQLSGQSNSRNIVNQLNSGIRGELPSPKVKDQATNLAPDQNSELKVPEPDNIQELPVQELSVQPSTPFQEIDNLVNQGIDPDTAEGLQKIEENLLASGKYTDDEVYDALMNYERQATPEVKNLEEPVQQNPLPEQLDELPQEQSNPYDSYSLDDYVNPSEESLLKNLTANRLPGFEIPMQRDFEMPMGYYEKGPKGEDVFVPLKNAQGQKVMQKIPFEFGNKLEAEIFPYGADYLDYRRERDPEFDIKNPRLSNAKKTTQQIDDLYAPVARQLLAEGQDIDRLRTQLSPEGQVQMDKLMQEFTKNLYSGQSKEGNSVMTHVPNSIKKNLITQILEKGGVSGKNAQAQAQFLRSLTPEQLKGFNLKTSSEAHKNLAPLTQRYRTQFRDLLSSEGILPANKAPQETQPINNIDQQESMAEPIMEPQAIQDVKGQPETPDIEQEMSSYTDNFLKENGIGDELSTINETPKGEVLPEILNDTENSLKPPLEDLESEKPQTIETLETPVISENNVVKESNKPAPSKLQDIGKVLKESEFPIPKKITYKGKDFDVVGIQEETGLPIIATPNKDGTISRLPLTQRATNQTNWNDLKKKSNDYSGEFNSAPELDLVGKGVLQEILAGLSRVPKEAGDIVALNSKYGSQIPTTYRGSGGGGAYYNSSNKTVSVPSDRAKAMTHEQAHEFNFGAFKNDPKLYSQSMRKLEPLFKKYPEFKKNFDSVIELGTGQKELPLEELHSDWYNHKLNAGANSYPHSDYILKNGSPEDLKIIDQVVKDIDRSYTRTKKDPIIPEHLKDALIQKYYKTVEEGIKSGAIYDPEKVYKETERDLAQIPADSIKYNLHKLYQKNQTSERKSIPAKLYNDTRKFIDQILKSDRTTVDKSRYLFKILDKINESKDKTDTLSLSNLLQDIRSNNQTNWNDLKKKPKDSSGDINYSPTVLDRPTESASTKYMPNRTVDPVGEDYPELNKVIDGLYSGKNKKGSSTEKFHELMDELSNSGSEMTLFEDRGRDFPGAASRRKNTTLFYHPETKDPTDASFQNPSTHKHEEAHSINAQSVNEATKQDLTEILLDAMVQKHPDKFKTPEEAYDFLNKETYPVKSVYGEKGKSKVISELHSEIKANPKDWGKFAPLKKLVGKDQEFNGFIDNAIGFIDKSYANKQKNLEKTHKEQYSSPQFLDRIHKLSDLYHKVYNPAPKGVDFDVFDQSVLDANKLIKYGKSPNDNAKFFPNMPKSPVNYMPNDIKNLKASKQQSIIPENFQLDLTPEEIKAYTDKPNEVQNRDYYHGAKQKLDKFLDAEKSPVNTARRYGNYNYTTNNPHEASEYGDQIHHLTVDSDRSMWNVKDFLKDNPSLLKNVNTLLKTPDIKQNEKLKPIVEEFRNSVEQANKRGDITRFFQLLKEQNPEKSVVYKDLLKNLTGLDTRIVHQSSGDWALPFSGNQVKINKVETKTKS